VTLRHATVVEQAREASLPAPGTWVIDPSHSRVGFVARYMMVTKVRGHFGEVEGTIHIAEDPATSWAEASFGAASIDTGDARRDDHLRAPDFLDVERFPQLTYRSTRVSLDADGALDVSGDLTIKGVTRPVTLHGRIAGAGNDPWGNRRAMFSLEGEIDREDFGITWNQALESGGVLVGKKVGLEIEVSAVAA
jgi:polyisoprenoid-binding protein YceI